MTNTTTSPATNATTDNAATTSRARRAIGLCASVCVLVTANAAFAATPPTLDPAAQSATVSSQTTANEGATTPSHATPRHTNRSGSLS